ncbi:hypothetical protein D7X25_15520 [bacterium 1XD42-8]|jgi:stage III sporulation protein AB|nr:hypothetical protein D7X25_15520 [bacterium 1XD42-8]
MNGVIKMLKLFGIICIMAGSAGMGYLQGREWKGRLNQWKIMKKMCLLIRSEIQYKGLPLPEAFISTAGKIPSPFQEMLKEVEEKMEERKGAHLPEIWREAVKKFMRKTSLNRQDIERLCTFGEQVGYFDKEVQMSAIDWYVEELEKDIAQNEKTIGQKVHMCHCLGILGGLFLTILFL